MRRSGKFKRASGLSNYAVSFCVALVGLVMILCSLSNGNYHVICYAHRGASAYEIGNTMAAFQLAVEQGADGIETDIRETSDGVLVLSHDDELKAVSGEVYSIRDTTYDQLRVLSFLAGDKAYIICSLDELLSEFSKLNIQFALEIKVSDIEQKVVEAVQRYGIEEQTVITSFQWEYIENVIKINSMMKTGYLVDEITTEIINKIQEAGVYEVCPKYSTVARNDVEYCHSLGLLVRPWGLASNRKEMKRMCEMGVDGFTFNDPKWVSNYLGKNKR